MQHCDAIYPCMYSMLYVQLHAREHTDTPHQSPRLTSNPPTNDLHTVQCNLGDATAQRYSGAKKSTPNAATLSAPVQQHGLQGKCAQASNYTSRKVYGWQHNSPKRDAGTARSSLCCGMLMHPARSAAAVAAAAVRLTTP